LWNNNCTYTVASYPGLLTPAFVACRTNAGEGLVKLSHVVWRTWTCGGVARSSCTAVKRLSESKKRQQDCLMLSAQSFYGPCFRSVVHSLTCCFSRKVPLLHTSRYVIPRDSVLPGLPCVSTASDKRWGEKAWVQGYLYCTNNRTNNRTENKINDPDSSATGYIQS